MNSKTIIILTVLLFLSIVSFNSESGNEIYCAQEAIEPWDASIHYNWSIVFKDHIEIPAGDRGTIDIYAENVGNNSDGPRIIIDNFDYFEEKGWEVHLPHNKSPWPPNTTQLLMLSIEVPKNEMFENHKMKLLLYSNWRSTRHTDPPLGEYELDIKITGRYVIYYPEFYIIAFGVPLFLIGIISTVVLVRKRKRRD